jgi:hypothetical protein
MTSFIKETLGLSLPSFTASTTSKDSANIKTHEVSESDSTNECASPSGSQDICASELRPAGRISTANFLISSPYTEIHHQLDLSTLDAHSALLARALTDLHAATTLYATTTYANALSWGAVIEHLRKLCADESHTWTRQSFYVVAFYSKLKDGIDKLLLHQLDKESHAEAVKSGGLLKYWFGSPNEERRNLATCESPVIIPF